MAEVGAKFSFEELGTPTLTLFLIPPLVISQPSELGVELGFGVGSEALEVRPDRVEDNSRLTERREQYVTHG